MAMTYATISGKITQPGSSVGIRARVTATPMTTANALKFPVEDQITWGPETAETNSAGVLSTLKVPTNHGIPELFWRLEAERLDQARGVPKRWTLGTYQITADANLADLVQIDVTVVSGTVLVSVADMLADTQAARDAAAASETAAAGSATTAQGWATAAASSAADSDTSADLAAASQASAATSEATATTKATEAAASQAAAATSETSAAASASTATTKAGEAAASATTAQGYAQQAAGSVSLVAWAPATAYAAGDVRQAPDGSTVRRNTSGTSGATFDATEEAAWTAVSAVAGTIEQRALTASFTQKPTTDLGDWALLRRDTSDVEKGVRWTTTDEVVARALGWHVLADGTDGTEFDAALAALPSWSRVYIPQDATVSLGEGHTLPKPVTIDGPGRILDTRVAPTSATLTIPVAASGTVITCAIDGSVSGSYIESHNAIYFQGTDNGAGVAATPVTGVIIDSPRISGFGRYAVHGRWVADSTIDIGEVSHCGHGGVVIQSAENVPVHIRRLHDIGPGLTGQTYGIDFDRKDSATDLVRHPRSTNCSGRIDVTYDCPGMFLLGTHGGHHLHFEFGSAYGIKRAINVGAGEMDDGSDWYAPSNITFRGGYADSGVTDGSGDSAVVIAGGFDVGTSTVVEYATGVSGHIDTIKGFGNEADSIGGAVYCRTTRGLSLSFGTIQEPSPRAVNMYHTNVDYSIAIGVVLDAWSNTLADADLINHTGSNNTGTITMLRGARGTKTATKVNTRGVVAASSTNKIWLGAATDMTACATKISGYVSGWTRWSSVANQMGWVLDGTLQALFYASGLIMTNGQKLVHGASTTANASGQIQAGTAPTSPTAGDYWATSTGVRIYIAGATRRWFTGFEATATLDFPSVAAGGSQELTVTVTGAVAGDRVTLGPPATIEAGLVWNGYVSAADTVKVRVSNITGSAIDPASASWSISVIK